MRKQYFSFLTTSLLIGLLTSSTVALAEDSNSYPLRKTYPEIKVIETSELTSKLRDFAVVDVRPVFEYELLHIQGAINIPLEDSTFKEGVKKLSNETGKPLVFYCGTQTCAKAYQAPMKTRQVVSLDRALAYDSGIEAWVKANPQLTISLNKPLDPKMLITEEKFTAHLLSPKDFVNKATADTTAKVIDLRDLAQNDGVSLFPLRDIRNNLDISSLRKIINEAKQANQAIYVYDYAGNKIRSIQYLLEDTGMKDYYFMRGGMNGYFEMLKGK